MNFKDLIDCAIEDLDDFFDARHTSQITAETTARGIMRASGIDKARRLQIQSYIANTQVETLDQITWCLLMAGHEMCHLMNNHNKKSDWIDVERKALEVWADFCGARMAFTLITHGTRVKEIISTALGPLTTPFSLPSKFWQERILVACGNSLDTMFAQLPAAATSKYPSRAERLLTITAGINSFFYRYFGKIDEKWTFFVYEKLAFGRTWFSSAGQEMYGKELDYSQPKAINEIHKCIADARASISPGLKREYEILIGTSYNNTERGRRRAAAAMSKEFAKWKTDFGPEIMAFMSKDKTAEQDS